MSEPTLRPGGPADLDWLLGLFDEAVAWMVARGQPGQWGTEPWSRDPVRRTRIAAMLADNAVTIAVDGDTDAGCLMLGEPPAHVGPAGRPERYVNLLIVSRARAGRQIGERLVAAAVAQARAAGVGLLRVDCWAGAPTLVAWYEARGFVPTQTFEVNDGEWVGQVFEMELGGG